MFKTVIAHRLLLGAAIVSSLGIGYALGAQPHMDEALVLLQSARTATSCPAALRCCDTRAMSAV
ncbi:MAG: hypothetical protein ACXWJT_00690, partial [Xanthobacteraceae bacterium]